MTSRRAAELFHLVFLRALMARIEDRSLVCLKGGCNLRFFFGSIRYSEDIDLDVAVIAKGTLKKKVDGLLRAPLVTAPLRAQGIEIVEVTAPKQTETTQRWKAGLRIEAIGETVRTKIELSRRAGAMGEGTFEPVRSAVLSMYGLPPFLATHYRAPEAIAQKIRALGDRAQPQARDVFDLSLLFAKASEVELSALQKRWLPGAIERGMSISFDEYRAQVVAFLEPEQAEPYASREAWDLMQETVVGRLEALSQ